MRTAHAPHHDERVWHGCCELCLAQLVTSALGGEEGLVQLAVVVGDHAGGGDQRAEGAPVVPHPVDPGGGRAPGAVGRHAYACGCPVRLLVTGGAGGLGRKVAEWMIDNGAGNLVLVGRTKPFTLPEATCDL